MPFDAAVFAALANEMSTALSGARCDRIGAVTPAELVFGVRVGNQDFALVLSVEGPLSRVHLAPAEGARGKGRPEPNPPVAAPPFVLLLRKHLLGCRIEAVTQAPWERQLAFALVGPSDEFPRRRYALVYELLGTQANVLLVDGRGLLLGALRPPAAGEGPSARLVIGAAYVPPRPVAPPPTEATLAYLTRALGLAAPEAPARAALQRNLGGLGPWAARFLLRRCNLDPEALCGSLTQGDLASLHRALADFGAAVAEGRFSPTLYREAGRPRDFWAFAAPAPTGSVAEPAVSLSGAITLVFGERVGRERLERTRQALLHRLDGEIARVSRRHAAQVQDLSRAEGAEDLRRCGDVLLANLARIPRGATSFTGEAYGEPGALEVQLDPRLSPQENAQHYFARYRKAKRGLKEAASRLAETAAALAELRLLRLEVLDAATLRELAELSEELPASGRPAPAKRPDKGPAGRPRKAPPAPAGRSFAPRRYWSSDGLEILVGRTSRENDRLTLHSGAPWDVWLHVKDLPGAHVIVRLPNEAPAPASSILEAAQLAAYHSEGRASTQVPVDYTLRRHVRKTPGGGPGQVLYDHHRTVFVTPDPALVERLRSAPLAAADAEPPPARRK
ncbi:MAG: NFACT family protein [Chitinophagales bacterium]